jgi:ADP-ribose pyrophosphatase
MPNSLPPHARRVFKGKIFDVYHYNQELFDGSKEVYEKLTRQNSCQIIAVTSEKKIILLHEEQPGCDPFIGLPGGRVGAGEDPFAAAKRELLEETGYTSNDWVLYCESSPSDKIVWSIYTYIAYDAAQTGSKASDPGERSETEFVTFDQFIHAVCREDFRSKDLALRILRMRMHDPSLCDFRRWLRM